MFDLLIHLAIHQSPSPRKERFLPSNACKLWLGHFCQSTTVLNLHPRFRSSFVKQTPLLSRLLRLLDCCWWRPWHGILFVRLNMEQLSIGFSCIVNIHWVARHCKNLHRYRLQLHCGHVLDVVIFVPHILFLSCHRLFLLVQHYLVHNHHKHQQLKCWCQDLK